MRAVGSNRAQILVALAREDARQRNGDSNWQRRSRVPEQGATSPWPESPAPNLSVQDVELMNNVFSTAVRQPTSVRSQKNGPQARVASAAGCDDDLKNTTVLVKPGANVPHSFSDTVDNASEGLVSMTPVSQSNGRQSKIVSVPIPLTEEVPSSAAVVSNTETFPSFSSDATVSLAYHRTPTGATPLLQPVPQTTGIYTGTQFYPGPCFGAPTVEVVGDLQLDLNNAGSTITEVFTLLPIISSVDATDNNNNDSLMAVGVFGETPISSSPVITTGVQSTTPLTTEFDKNIKNVGTDATCRRELFPSNEGSGTREGGDWESGMILDADANGHQLSVTEDEQDNTVVINENTQSDPVSSDHVDGSMDHEPEVTPPVTRKRRQPAPVTNSPRKRGKNTVCWKSSVAKAAYNAGQAHVNWRGKEIAAKRIGPGCSPATCKRNCHEIVSMEEREILFNSYYSIADANRKWDFLVRLTKKVPTIRPTAGDSSRRSNTYKYTIHLSDGEIKTVCQKFFLDTIDQSHQVVKTAHTKLENGKANIISPDKRGRHNKKCTMKPQTKSSVREHIASFKTVESHYCRKTSKFKYLPENLNVRKMHSMYLIERNNAPHTANLRQYRDIFNKEFHLKFLKLKKDRCSQCENWKHRTIAEKSAPGEQEKFDMHIANKKKGEELKRQDSLRVKTEKQLCVASFDFQKILYCPKGENAAYFYRNKFKCFDFTIFDHRTKQGWCYVWDQTLASKGANEVASCLLLFIEEKAKEGIREIVFYSDNCWSQNKNTKVLSMMNLASVKFGITITHRFLEKGHTHMEVDNVHACIENRSRNLDVFTPGQWYAVIKSAKINDPKYKVIEMEQKSFLEFKELAGHHKWNLGITKLREIVLSVNNASFKHNYDDEATRITPLPPRPGRPVNLPTFKLKPAYTRKFAVPPNIIEDLKWYCDQGHIPSASQPYFRSLFDPAQGVQEEIPSDSELEGESDSEPEVQGDSD